MKALCCTLLLLLVFGACAIEKTEDASPAPTQPASPPTATQPAPETASAPAASDGEAVKGTWAGQIRIDAHAGMARLDYVGAESGDFVPMRFRTDSAVGTKILAECADEDLCEVEGSVRFLDEPPPENASAVGEIVSVDRVKKLPPEAR
ncbi:MAG TPA: hypothetical protein VEK11_21795 [Thermoanaerobaculia bacterium]|nr:hypothetical protein [Thermoanaerobaculia bacterium]